MHETLTLSALQLTDKDLKVLRSLLKLTSARGTSNWIISTAPGGDASLVDVDDPRGEDLYAKLTNDAGEHAVALSKRRKFNGRFVLHKPLRARQLIKVLNTLSADAAAQSGRYDWHPGIMQFDGNALPMAEHLRRNSWSRPVVLTGEKGQQMVIDPGSGAWYSDAPGHQLAALLETRFPAESARPLSSGELVMLTRGLTRQNLSGLKWRAGLAESSGLLHPDLAGQASYMLPKVPPPAAADTAYSRLARILIREPVTFTDLLAESGAETEDAVEFLNACYACGFLLVQHAEQKAVNA